ncbi:uncharacterized protein LOC123557230 [Mercenaria mercenaria]|uniref:uncharacterized protein LOC123557230 n=1 Tax=Mercenaria mercenaria TaxID=6596 RepID=UPI001E1DC4C9|nr:uncharacterized protein LOC123557230 [Mercenaria mercenaria]
MNPFTMYLLLIWIFCVSGAKQQRRQGQQVYEESFFYRSHDALQHISYKLDIFRCSKAAWDKATRVSPRNPGRFAAITWISMYSRLCHIDKRLLIEDLQNSNFPFRLNKELRCTLHKNRNREVRDIFLKAGNMIDEALDILKPTLYTENLYRGLTDFPYRDLFIEDGFFSTTKDIHVALGFAKGNILQIITHMYGVYIANYAEERFRYQKEVLAKRQAMFQIGRKVTDEGQIKQIIEGLKLRKKRLYPKEIIYMEQVFLSDDVRNELSRNQQSQSHPYCEPSY